MQHEHVLDGRFDEERSKDAGIAAKDEDGRGAAFFQHGGECRWTRIAGYFDAYGTEQLDREAGDGGPRRRRQGHNDAIAGTNAQLLQMSGQSADGGGELAIAQPRRRRREC